MSQLHALRCPALRFQGIISFFLIVCTLFSYIPVQAAAPVEHQPDNNQSPLLQPIQPAQQDSTIILSSTATGDPLTIALDYIHSHRFELGLTEADLSEIIVKNRYLSQHNGVTHLYLRQRWRGIEVYNGDININVLPDGRILNLGNRFVSDLSYQVQTTTPSVSALNAVRNAANSLGLVVNKTLQITANAQGTDGAIEVSGGGFASQSIPVRLVYYQSDTNHQEKSQVLLAWTMTIHPTDSSDVFDLRVDAHSGAILESVNLTSDAGMHYQPASPPQRSLGLGPQRRLAASLAEPAPNSYFVYDLPAMDPHDGERTLVTNPADPVASPFGWHDTNGAAGAEFTTTRGNNAFAYADLDVPDGFGLNDVTTNGGASLIFSATADLSQSPATYRDAAITNLFYITNKTHDLLYHYGFDEASGNFQVNNYSRGGLGNDAINAEAQDYSGLNNANFYTPPDGLSPQMQMYLASDKTTILSITANPPNASYLPGQAEFGPANFDITGTVKLVTDTVGVTTDGCQTILSDVNGKIALIDRGNCDFRQKAVNAQSAGAIAAVIINNVAGAAPSLGDGQPANIPVTIPVLSMAQSDGNGIKSLLGANTVSMRLEQQVAPGNDGSLDNGVIIHEIGHGLSNRLTGGPANVNCVAALESQGLGEGWSDFLSLVLTANAQDTSTTPIPVGRWLKNQDANGSGFRHYPYTTDIGANPLSFGDVALVNPFSGKLGEVHDVGEVWASALWEVYWNLVNTYGFDPDLYHGNGGNNLALQFVIDGMKLQPCNPTFVEARDAILAADVANNDGAALCKIWEGFAKRGLGYSASAGNSHAVVDSVEAFDLPPACTVDVQPTALEVCAPADATFDITIGPSFAGDVTLSASNLPTNTTAGFSNNPIAHPNHSTFTVSNIGAAQPDIYQLKVVGVGMTAIYTTPVSLKISAPFTLPAVLIAPADGANEVSVNPLFSWQPITQATTYLFELSEEPTFATLYYSSTMATTTTSIPFALRSQRTYYWSVTAQNQCTALASAIFSLRVQTVPSLLLVDDDGATSGVYNIRPKYISALNTLQIPFDQWGTGLSAADEPEMVEELGNYSTILWVSGYSGDGPGSNSEAVLTQFLNQNKCVIISARDYFYYSGLSPFMTSYLGVESALDDNSTGTTWQTVVTGTAPIFEAVGTHPLLFFDGNFSDILTPTISAGVAFQGNVGPAAAVYKDGGNYRSLYSGFEFESLPATSFTQTLQSALDWCTFQSDLSIQHQLEPDSTLLPGQPVTYTIVYSNSAVGIAEGVQITATLPVELVDLTAISANGTITQISTAAHIWQVPNLAAGEVNTLTITGKVNPTLTTPVTLTIAANIGGKSFDIDPTNHATTSLQRSVIVPHVSLASTQIDLSEAAGTVEVITLLELINPYATTHVTLSTSAGNASPDVDYRALNEPLIIPAGELTTTFMLDILDDPEVEIDETFLIELSDAHGAILGSPISTTVSILDEDQAHLSFAQALYTATESSGNLSITAQLDQINPVEDVSALLTMTPRVAGSSELFSTVVTIPVGAISTTALISIVDDLLVESNERFILQLIDPINASLGQPLSATLNVIDDDLPQISFAQHADTVSESAGSLSTTIHLNQPNVREVVSVVVNLSLGNAHTSQIVASSTLITIPSGAISTTLTLSLMDDQLDQADRVLLLELTEPTNATLGQPVSTTLTIADDDLPPPTLTVTVTSSVLSGALLSANENVTYTVTISNNGGPSGAGAMTVTVPSNSLYVPDSGDPTPTPGPSTGVAATGEAAAPQILSWNWSSIGQNAQRQFKFSLKLVDATAPLSTMIIVSGSGLTQPVTLTMSHPTQPAVDTTRRVYLPVVSR